MRSYLTIILSLAVSAYAADIGADALKQGGLFSEWKSTKSIGTEFISDGFNGTPSIKVSFPDPDSTGGIITSHVAVSDGMHTLTLKVRGAGRLAAHFFQYDGTKKVLIKDMQDLGALGADWKEIKKRISISNGTALFTMNYLMFKANGWFELGDIKFIADEKTVKPSLGVNPRRLGSDGPVGCWSFDTGDASGLTIYDRAGNAHGDLAAGTIYTPGKNGQAVRFDGATGKIVGDGAPVLGQNFTIAAWFRSEHFGEKTHTPEGQHSIYAGDAKGCHYFRVNADGKLALIRSDIAGVANSSAAVAAGDWTHIAMTYGEDGSYVFYINGRSAGAGTAKHQPFVNADRYCLGQANAGGPIRAMKGDLDDVFVYDRVLSGSEIQSLLSRSLDAVSADERTARRTSTLGLNITGSAEYNWFTFGKPVTFLPEGGIIDEAIRSFTGTVYDARNRKITELTLPRAAFMNGGWKWQPSAPGYYEIAFSYHADGKDIPLALAYNLQTTRGTVKQFSRARRAVAVMPPITGKRPPQFGVTPDTANDREAKLASFIGFNFARIWVDWGDHWDKTKIVAKKRGEYDWKHMDEKIETLKQYGINEFFATLIGTPQWASPYPDRTEVDICVSKFAAWAPTDMKDWTDFVEAIVKRYGSSMKDWEMWNEPHLPNGSVFWRDTTEKYAELVKSGYDTIKRIDTSHRVWLGGQGGKRYLPFYREFLRLGGAPFDVLSMHGAWPGSSIPEFRELETSFKAPSRVWGSTEWHGILISAMEKPPSEAALAKRMILDLCDQLKYGAQRIAVFTMMEGHGEKELLPVAFEDGSFQQSAGLFRHRPLVEPRPAAVALRVFIDQVSSTLVYTGTADLTSGQRIVYFKDGAKTFAVLWTEGSSAEPDSRIRSALASAAVTTAEGYPLTGAFAVEPERMYFIKGLPESLFASLPQSTASLNPDVRALKAAVAVPRARYATKPILDTDLNTADTLPWVNVDWNYVQTSVPKPDGLKGRFALSIGAQGLDIVIDVKDPVFTQNEKMPDYWKGDSVQFAIDTDGTGSLYGQTEFVAALTPTGPLIYKAIAASVGGDLPQRWTAANAPLKHGRILIDRNGPSLRYRIHIDATELYPFDVSARKTVRFSVLINNNDGAGRAGYLEWSSGIGAAKDAVYYGKLEPE